MNGNHTTRRSLVVGVVATSAAAVTALSQGDVAAHRARYHAPSSEQPITYVIKFHVRPDKRDAFLSLLTDVLDTMRNEATFHQAALHRDPQSDHRFMLYETWASHDDVVNVQLKRPYRDAWHAALPELLQEERDISVWQPIWAGRYD